MKAIIINSPGGPEVLTVTELPDPVPAADEVLIAVEAFGLNHAEAYMRSGSFGEVAKVTGIECAGTVVTDPSGRLAEGAAVVAILGGVSRAARTCRARTPQTRTAAPAGVRGRRRGYAAPFRDAFTPGSRPAGNHRHSGRSCCC